MPHPDSENSPRPPISMKAGALHKAKRFMVQLCHVQAKRSAQQKKQATCHNAQVTSAGIGHRESHNMEEVILLLSVFFMLPNKTPKANNNYKKGKKTS